MNKKYKISVRVMVLILVVMLMGCENKNMEGMPEGMPAEHKLSEDSAPIGQATFYGKSEADLARGFSMPAGWNTLRWPEGVSQADVINVTNSVGKNKWFYVYEYGTGIYIFNPNAPHPFYASASNKNRPGMTFRPNILYGVYIGSSGVFKYVDNSTKPNSPAAFPPGKNCYGGGHSGSHGAISLPNGDKRFVCWDGQWYAWANSYTGANLIRDTGWYFAQSVGGSCKKIPGGYYYARPRNSDTGENAHWGLTNSSLRNECG